MQYSTVQYRRTGADRCGSEWLKICDGMREGRTRREHRRTGSLRDERRAQHAGLECGPLCLAACLAVGLSLQVFEVGLAWLPNLHQIAHAYLLLAIHDELILSGG